MAHTITPLTELTGAEIRGLDTQYVNMHLAYDELSGAMKKKIDGLKAIHVYLSKYSPRPLKPLNEDSLKSLPPPGIHPLVRVHPENGRKALFLNPVRIEGIVGMPDDDVALARGFLQPFPIEDDDAAALIVDRGNVL